MTSGFLQKSSCKKTKQVYSGAIGVDPLVSGVNYHIGCKGKNLISTVSKKAMRFLTMPSF